MPLQHSVFFSAIIVMLSAMQGHTPAMAQEPVVKGQTPTGNSYIVYADGSAGLDAGDVHWSIDCKIDKISDDLSCSITGGSNYDFFIAVGSTGDAILLCALGHDFPGRTGAIRFDKNQSLETDEKGCVDGKEVRSMALASSAVTRTWKWPYDWPVDRETSIV